MYVTFLGKDTEQEINSALKVLQGAGGYLRTALGKAMRMRQVPNLKFKFDQAQAEGRNMSALIAQARKRDAD